MVPRFVRIGGLIGTRTWKGDKRLKSGDVTGKEELKAEGESPSAFFRYASAALAAAMAAMLTISSKRWRRVAVLGLAKTHS